MTAEQYEKISEAASVFEATRSRVGSMTYRDAKHELKRVLKDAGLGPMEAVQIGDFAYRLDSSYFGIVRIRLIGAESVCEQL